jgi:hypothetical protein
MNSGAATVMVRRCRDALGHPESEEGFLAGERFGMTAGGEVRGRQKACARRWRMERSARLTSGDISGEKSRQGRQRYREKAKAGRSKQAPLRTAYLGKKHYRCSVARVIPQKDGRWKRLSIIE